MRLVRYSYPSFRNVRPAFGGFVRSPWSGLETEIDRLFRSTLSEPGSNASPTRFPVDLYEDKENTYVRAELPGFSREDINVEVVDGQLKIAAVRKTRSTSSGQAPSTGSGQAPADGTQQAPEETVSLSRSVNIADEVQADKITATHENGVLTVTLPKREETKPKKITVAVK